MATTKELQAQLDKLKQDKANAMAGGREMYTDWSGKTPQTKTRLTKQYQDAVNSISSQIKDIESQLYDSSRNDAQNDMYESLKDKFKGFDKNGNAIIEDNGEAVSFDKKDFNFLNDKFRQSNPEAKDGGYEDYFNKNQFDTLASQGNKFQGVNESGESIYRNAMGDLENFGKTGGFADYVSKNLADKKFSMVGQGSANTVAGENKKLNPFEPRQGVNNVNRSGSNLLNPTPTQSPSTTPVNNLSGMSKGFYESQMDKQAQQQNAQVQKQKQAQTKTTSAPPSLTGMAANFAAKQAEKQAAPVIQDTKAQVGNQVQAVTGVNPYSSIKNQAINKVANVTGVDNSYINAALNPQQAAKSYAASNIANAITSNTGADSGVTNQLVNTLVGGGNLQQAATQLATNKAKDMALDYAKDQLADTALGNALNVVPGGFGSALRVGKALTGGGSSEQKGAAAAQAAARAALGAATGGVSELVSPEMLAAGGSGLTNIKDSKTLNNMGVAGDAVKGATGLGSGVLNLGSSLGNTALTSVGNTGTSTVKNLKTAGQGVKQITQGNVGTGLKNIASAGVQAAIDTFLKNPANVAGSAINTIGRTLGKVGSAIGDALSWVCFDPETEVYMEDGSLKKVKDIKVGDKMLMGGAVNGVGQSIAKEMVYYGDVLVSATHAVFEDGKWIRVGESKKAIKTDLEKHVVVPISNQEHIIITKDKQVWADITEVEDTQEYTEEERIDKLNSQKNKNRSLKVWMNANKKV